MSVMRRLVSTKRLKEHAYVQLVGSKKSFGRVHQSQKQPDGTYLNLIRSAKKTITGEEPVYSWEINE